MEPLIAEPPPTAAIEKEVPVFCRGSFFVGALVGVLVAAGAMAIALWQLGLIGSASPPALAPTGNTSRLGCTLASDVEIMLVQGNTWESDGGNKFRKLY